MVHEKNSIEEIGDSIYDFDLEGIKLVKLLVLYIFCFANERELCCTAIVVRDYGRKVTIPFDPFNWLKPVFKIGDHAFFNGALVHVFTSSRAIVSVVMFVPGANGVTGTISPCSAGAFGSGISSHEKCQGIQGTCVNEIADKQKLIVIFDWDQRGFSTADFRSAVAILFSIFECFLARMEKVAVAVVFFPRKGTSGGEHSRHCVCN